MKVTRWAAAAALTLISLMNIGTAMGGDSDPVAVRVLAPLLGLLGIAAVYGLLRHRAWGAPSALTAGAINVAGAVAAVALDTSGAAIGLAVSAVALLLAALTSYTERARHPQVTAD